MPIPVPPTLPGYRLGSGDAPVQIEAFIDVECPFSKKAWPTLQKLIEQDRDRIAITVNPMVLCDHRQSWDLTKALVAVALAGRSPTIANQAAPKAWAFISHLYQHQQEFANEAFDTKTREDLFRLIERLMDKFDPNLPVAELTRAISDEGGEIANCAKASIRYAIGRSVWSTPTFFINGSEVPQLESSSTPNDWQDFLKNVA
jgi:protein-disulfide isomerase